MYYYHGLVVSSDPTQTSETSKVENIKCRRQATRELMVHPQQAAEEHSKSGMHGPRRGRQDRRCQQRYVTTLSYRRQRFDDALRSTTQGDYCPVKTLLQVQTKRLVRAYLAPWQHRLASSAGVDCKLLQLTIEELVYAAQQLQATATKEAGALSPHYTTK